MNNKITWNPDADINGTSLRGYLMEREWPWSFEETVARLTALSGQDPAEKAGDKTSVEFIGQFNGETFTLYDYKGDNCIHIGGGRGTDVGRIRELVRAALEAVPPAPYRAVVTYDETRAHGWSASAVVTRAMPQHTPGPWHKERNNSPHSVYPYRIRHDNGDGTTRDISECWHLEDARLIAEAPKMAELLRWAHDRLVEAEELRGWPGEEGPQAKRNKIRALLARIDGDEK